MVTSQKDIIEEVNRNVDENFGQLDQRIMDNNKLLFRKAIFALIGGLSVVIFGYAYIHNRISKNYDINFYEKMIDNKISKLQGLPYVIGTAPTFYTSVTKSQFDERYTSPEKYFDRFTMVDQIESMKKEIERLNSIVNDKGVKTEKSTFYNSVTKVPESITTTTQKQKPKQGLFSKKSLFVVTIVLVIIVASYYLFKKPTDTSIVNFYVNMFKSIHFTNSTGVK
jgi:hypothetical protein